MPNISRRTNRAFTLVEMLVVVFIILLLIGILIPTVYSVRAKSMMVKCGANLKSIGTGVQLHMADKQERLPQMQVDSAGMRTREGDPNGTTVGALFGGRVGVVPFLGIDLYGASTRPLNHYVGLRTSVKDPGELSDDLRDEARATQIASVRAEVFESPLDVGVSLDGRSATDAPLFLPLEYASASDSWFRMMGSSYVINDHAISSAPSGSEPSDEVPTLIPCTGGPMPKVREPARTWLSASAPIYNYDRGDDLGMRWYSEDVEANILFADGHVETRVPVAGPNDIGLLQPFEGGPSFAAGQSNPVDPVATNVTVNYTFFPRPDWFTSDDAAPCP